MASDNKNYWQKTAGLYGFLMKKDPMYQEICHRMTSRLQPDMQVLELACGSGQLSFPLCRLVKKWNATDFSENMIRQAEKKQHPDHLTFSVMDATRLEYGHETWDVVVISNALHIMPEPEKALQEALRVLKPGGLLFAPTIVWNESGYSRLWKTGLRLTGFQIFHMWNAQQFTRFLEDQDFLIEESSVLQDRMSPLCYVVARKPERK